MKSANVKCLLGSTRAEDGSELRRGVVDTLYVFLAVVLPVTLRLAGLYVVMKLVGFYKPFVHDCIVCVQL